MKLLYIKKTQSIESSLILIIEIIPKFLQDVNYFYSELDFKSIFSLILKKVHPQ